MDTVQFFEDKEYTPLEEFIKSIPDENSPAERVKKATLKALETLYKDKGFTVREICDMYGAKYNNNVQKMFFRLFGAKGCGLGGDRRSKQFKSK